MNNTRYDMKKKVLVIEDDVFILELITEVLEEEGLEVVGATNGREGLELAYQHRPDLIVSDYVMPEADGIEVLRGIQARPETAGTPFLVISAHLSDPVRKRCAQIKEDVFILAKPFGTDELIEAVQKGLARIKLRRGR